MFAFFSRQRHIYKIRQLCKEILLVIDTAFKPYADLESRFNRVVGIKGTSAPATTTDAPPATTDSVPETTAKVAEGTVFEGNDDEFFQELQEEEETKK